MIKTAFAFTLQRNPGEPYTEKNNNYHENLQESPRLTKPQKRRQHPQPIPETSPLPTTHTPEQPRPLLEVLPLLKESV